LGAVKKKEQQSSAVVVQLGPQAAQARVVQQEPAIRLVASKYPKIATGSMMIKMASSTKA
jgi:hypothetical protein